MTFQERYNQEETWFGKVLVMEIYHLARVNTVANWTIGKTANDFGCSIGLVSENLRLAFLIHQNEAILKCSSRQEALKHLGGINGRSMEIQRRRYTQKLASDYTS